MTFKLGILLAMSAFFLFHEVSVNPSYIRVKAVPGLNMDSWEF